MNELFKRLPLVALLLGVTLAFASATKNNVVNKRFGKLVSGGNTTWVDLTGKIEGTHYECLMSSAVCSQEFVGDNPPNNPVAGSQRAGTFQLIP